MSSAAAAAGPTVRVKSVTSTSVTIYWTKVSSALSYEIQRSTDAKSWSTIATVVKTTEYTDSKSLTTGKSYAYRVRAKRLLGYTDYSAYVVGKPVPAQVTGLKVSAANNTQVKLAWNKVSGISGYTVQYYTGGKWKSLKHVTTNSYTVSGLKLGTNYHFRVAAYKTVSGKKVYGAVSNYIKANPVLAAPSKVVLTGVSASALQIQWAGVTGAKGYEVYVHEVKKWLDAGATKGRTIKGLEAGKTYNFTVRAYAGTTKGKSSATYSFGTKPAAPQNVEIKDVTDSTITFTWSPSTGAIAYQPAYRVAGGTWKNLSTTAGTTATVTGLTSRTNYEVRVRAYLTNSNVQNIIANAISAWSSVAKAATGLGAPVATAATSADTKELGFSWTSVDGATGYTVEKYDTFYQTWYVYDFGSEAFKSPENITEDSEIATTELSFTETAKQGAAGEVFRVRAIDENGIKGTPSNSVTCTTSDVSINLNSATYTLQQEITWPAIEGAVSYQILKRSPLTNYDVFVTFNAADVEKGNGTCKAKICLAPESAHSLMILAKDAQDRTHTSTNWVTFAIGQVPASFLSTSHKYYYSATNSQLHYLAQAINNTKAYKAPITVKNNSQIAYDINYLKLPSVLSIFLGGPLDGVCDTPEEIEKLFSKMDDSGEMSTSASETYDSTVLFEEGTGLTEDNKTVRLKTFIEPSSNGTATAYLYNGQDYKAWKNGFSSVTTKRNADGSTTMTLKFKQENMNSNYHNGFMSSFSADLFGAGSGFSVNSLTVGASTLTATIDKDGILTAYNAESPYSAKFAASFTADEDIKDDGVDIEAGSNITMEMGVAGKATYKYTIIR